MRGGVWSSGVGSLVLNVTVASETANGSVTVYSYGHSRPGTPNLPYVKAVTGSNLVTVPVCTGGTVTPFIYTLSLHDALPIFQGYILAGTPTVAGTFRSVGPARLLDTGTGVGA